MSLIHFPLGSSVTRCADPPLLSVRQRTGSVSQSGSGTDRSGRGVDRLSVGPKNRQPRVEKLMSLRRLRTSSLVPLFSLLLLLGVIGAEGSTVAGARGSSVLLDPSVKVNPKKNEVLWMFISSHKSPLTILHHIPSYLKWAEPSKQFNSRLRFIPSNGSLMVNRLQASDQGDYSFTMDRRQLKVISLLVFGELTKPSIQINNSSLNSTIQLTCTVDGDSPSYQWQKDGREVFQDQLLDGNKSLVIKSASRSDLGNYTCVVTNPVSSVQANYSLTIHDICLVENVAATTVLLSICRIIFSAVSFIGFLLLCCLRNELEEGSLRQLKYLYLLLFTCDTLSLVVISIVITSWIGIKGAADASVVALFFVVALLTLNVYLTVTIRILGCQWKRKFLVCTDLRALIDVCGIMRLIPVLISSIISVAEEIQQSNGVCHMLPLIWSTVASLVMVIVMISASSIVRFKRGGSSCSELKYQGAPKIETVKEMYCGRERYVLPVEATEKLDHNFHLESLLPTL